MAVSDLSNFVPLGAHAQRNDLNAVRTLTPAAGVAADVLMIQCQTKDVRFTLDGSNPSATVGLLIKAGDPPLIIRTSSVKVIEVAATAVLDYQWGRSVGLTV